MQEYQKKALAFLISAPYLALKHHFIPLLPTECHQGERISRSVRLPDGREGTGLPSGRLSKRGRGRAVHPPPMGEAVPDPLPGGCLGRGAGTSPGVTAALTPAAWNYVREITANAVEVSPDKQGRILIPAWLQEAASLQGTVVLSGVIDRVEIWDPEEFERAIRGEGGGFPALPPPDLRMIAAPEIREPRALGARGRAACRMDDRSSPFHDPVMVEEVLEVLEGAQGGTILDGTLGGGGHAEAMLTRWPRCRVLGVDRDPDALEAARHRLEPFGDRLRILNMRFDQAMDDAKVRQEGLDGALLDLGVSSWQLDADQRGFAFRRGIPLDMRMGGEGSGESAADLLNRESELELARVFREYGEEPRARRLAREVVTPPGGPPFRDQ